MPSKAVERFLAFSLGLIFPVAVILFKATIFGRNDLIEAQTGTIAKIFNFSRHRMIVANFVTQFASFGDGPFLHSRH